MEVTFSRNSSTQATIPLTKTRKSHEIRKIFVTIQFRIFWLPSSRSLHLKIYNCTAYFTWLWNFPSRLL
jgi:hypothetical protein